MHFTLVGAGAVGSLWGLSLAKAGHGMHWITRRHDATVMRALDTQPASDFPANRKEMLADSDCVLVCVKAFDVEQALANLQPNLHPDTPVILLHNGMGTADTALALLPDNPLLLATTSHGSLMVSDHHIRHTGCGETHLGGINAKGKQCDFLTDVLAHALPPVTWHSEITAALWRKLAVNCMINPLTAIAQCQNGALLSPEYLNQLQLLSREIASVMCAEGERTDAEEVLSSCLAVASATAQNYSSMNRDVYFKRRSEIDFITGYLINRATFHGIAAPENRALYQAIKEREFSYDIS